MMKDMRGLQYESVSFLQAAITSDKQNIAKIQLNSYEIIDIILLKIK
jgi:hypothetical protein